ncbi:MAG: right-handed parallel beta-helix repeat-containing protein [Kiritimatiellaeota bacterium]|nr:right-handed parallel beta-helix repeat-containing protein [Kiritimatiellota bacterium]
MSVMKIAVAVMGAAFLSAAHAATEVYVEQGARSGGDGSKGRPFATLEEARDKVREFRKNGSPGGPYTVVLKDGTYHRAATFDLKAEDSGIVFRAENPGKAKLYGGTVLPAKAFAPCKDETVLKRLKPEARGKVLVCDLAQVVGGDLPAFPKAFRGKPPPPFLYAGGEPQTLARWPNNDGWASFTNVLDTGLAEADADDPARRAKRPGVFVFDDDRAKAWPVGEGVWLKGYWTHDWSDETIQVASYDAATRAITLAAPHGYGIGAGTWGSKERRFYALNVLEELDEPGEWYIDRTAKRLYFYPGKDALRGEIVLATLNESMVMLNGASDVTFRGLQFAYTHGAAITGRKVERITVEGCALHNTGQDAIGLSEAANCKVLSCDIHNIGTTGIFISGGDRKKLVKAGNLLENNHVWKFGQFSRTYAGAFNVQGIGTTVRRNLMHDGPHLAVLYGGNEHTFELNEIHNVLHETGDAGAFYTGRDWTSQGNVVRYNYFHDLGGDNQGQSRHIMGIYLDDCDSGDTLHGNIFQRSGYAIFIGGGRDNTVTANLIIDSPVGIHFDARGMKWKQWNKSIDGWNLEGKAQEMDYKNPPWSTAYPRLAATMDNAPQEPLGNVFRDNLIIDAQHKPLDFDGEVRALFHKLESAGNAAVDTSGTNKLARIDFDPKGFANIIAPEGQPIALGVPDRGRGIFAFKKSKWFQQAMPALNEIPVEQIGLYKDAFRTKLPETKK